jgi:FkbH-like protein
VEKLKEFGLLEYFLYPQINWNSKALSIKKIAESINIGIDTFAFVDDQPFEREEVSHSHPVVMCLDSRNLNGFLDMPEMNPRFITEDSRIRRQMYLSEIERKRIEEQIEGPKEEFLATLDMVFTISSAMQEDLKRAEELTVRTNQLNATGYTYSYEELEQFSKSTDHKLWVAGLEDKYGTYGKIGLVLVECSHQVWTLKLLLMSCRVMSRGVGSVLLNQLMSEAKKNQVGLRAEFVQTDRNRMMYVTYKFSGFKEVAKNGKVVILENDLDNIQPCPEYVSLKTDI